MWIRITDSIVKKVEATHLKNPKNQGNAMILAFFQRENRTAFHRYRPKKVFLKYYQTPTGGHIARGKWTNEMKTFALQELEKLPPQEGWFKITIFGWIMLLFSFSLIGYAVYETITLPSQKKAYEERLAKSASVNEGDIYFGRYYVYKEKGNFADSKERGFGWFKVVKVADSTYHIAKSVEISDVAKPKEQLNSTNFDKETFAVRAKTLEAYHKVFTSEDELVEINFNEKKASVIEHK